MAPSATVVSSGQGSYHACPANLDWYVVQLRANVGALLFESSNPRHAHEWEVFANSDLPDDLVRVRRKDEDHLLVGELGDPFVDRVDEFPLGAVGLFVAGLYGGFIQAGVGFVLLTVLGSVMRYDVLRANALKLVCTLFFGVVALAVFALAGQVAWRPAAILAVATVVGSQLGVRFALSVDKRVVRAFVLCAVVVSAAAILLRA